MDKHIENSVLKQSEVMFTIQSILVCFLHSEQFDTDSVAPN